MLYALACPTVTDAARELRDDVKLVLYLYLSVCSVQSRRNLSHVVCANVLNVDNFGDINIF